MYLQGMACVGRTKECTIVPSNHYGPIPGVPVGTTWKFRVQVSRFHTRVKTKELRKNHESGVYLMKERDSLQSPAVAGMKFTARLHL